MKSGHYALIGIGLFIAGVLLVACEMYDANGFNDAGIHQETGTRYDPNGYDKDGYNSNGYDKDGYAGNGYDKDGYDKDGYAGNGYDEDGYDKDGYDSNGYDKDGFNAAGFDTEARHRETGEIYNPAGYDINGYDKNGFNAEGINRATGMIYDRYGYAKDGYTAAGDHRDDFILAAVNTEPYGIWSDGTTMWVSDSVDKKIYAYNMITKERDEAKDFNTLYTGDPMDATDDGNSNPGDIWSNGTTMWVIDSGDRIIYAYNMITKENDATKIIPASGTFLALTAIWSNGTTMWVGQVTSTLPIEAYDINDGTATDGSFTAEHNPWRIWSDGVTMWVMDIDREVIAAYTLNSGERDTSKIDFASLPDNPVGIWSNGTTMWVADDKSNRIYAYDMATRERPRKKPHHMN